VISITDQRDGAHKKPVTRSPSGIDTSERRGARRHIGGVMDALRAWNNQFSVACRHRQHGVSGNPTLEQGDSLQAVEFT
jgi:hypothetical protein